MKVLPVNLQFNAFEKMHRAGNPLYSIVYCCISYCLDWPLPLKTEFNIFNDFEIFKIKYFLLI